MDESNRASAIRELSVLARTHVSSLADHAQDPYAELESFAASGRAALDRHQGLLELATADEARHAAARDRATTSATGWRRHAKDAIRAADTPLAELAVLVAREYERASV